MLKAAITAVSTILVAGIVIGVFITARHTHHKHEDQLSTNMNIVSIFCSCTHYSESCYRTLSSANSTDPKLLIAKAISAAEDSVKQFFNYSDSLTVQAKNNSLTKMALDDCKDMMNYAVDSLQASYSDVNDGEIFDITERVNDLRTWLSAVMSYQQSCLDGFEQDSDMKETVQKGMVDSRELTGNALTIVTHFLDIISTFDIKFPDLKPKPQKVVYGNKNSYPPWFSAKDRRLLARIDNKDVIPNAVVAQDGSGQFKTIGAALAAAPKNLDAVRHVIYVKAGIYDECINVDKGHTNILLYGDGPTKTIVTGAKGANDGDGMTTWRTATFVVIGKKFVAKSMGVHNSAGPEMHQAVALRVQSDKSIFFDCRIDSYQNTLLNQANRQFFRNCVVSGTIDFIFGDSPAIIQNPLIIVKKPMDHQFNTITAQGKDYIDENTGTVIQNCRIVPEPKLDKFETATYLGRPWKKYSTTVIMESELGDFIRPEGWIQFEGRDEADYRETIYYGEYNNRGNGANLHARVNWKGYHKMDRVNAMKFTLQSFLSSKEMAWLPLAGIPFTATLRY